MIACPLPNSRVTTSPLSTPIRTQGRAALARDHIVKRPERFLAPTPPEPPAKHRPRAPRSPERCDEDSVDKPVRCLRGGRSRLRRLRSSGQGAARALGPLSVVSLGTRECRRRDGRGLARLAVIRTFARRRSINEEPLLLGEDCRSSSRSSGPGSMPSSSTKASLAC